MLDSLQLDSTYRGVYDTADVVLVQPWQNEINTINLPRISILSEAWSAGALVGGGGMLCTSEQIWAFGVGSSLSIDLRFTTQPNNSNRLYKTIRLQNQ